MTLPASPSPSEWLDRLISSHRALLGRELGDDPKCPPDPAFLYADAPFCLLAHDAGEDPRFVFANCAAQRCFEYSRDELIGLPSRLSAGPDDRDERARLLSSVAERGYAEGYRGLRVAKSGRRFWIEDVTVWNVLDAQGRFQGQAAVYRHTRPA